MSLNKINESVSSNPKNTGFWKKWQNFRNAMLLAAGIASIGQPMINTASADGNTGRICNEQSLDLVRMNTDEGRIRFFVKGFGYFASSDKLYDKNGDELRTRLVPAEGFPNDYYLTYERDQRSQTEYGASFGLNKKINDEFDIGGELTLRQSKFSTSISDTDLLQRYQTMYQGVTLPKTKESTSNRYVGLSTNMSYIPEDSPFYINGQAGIRTEMAKKDPFQDGHTTAGGTKGFSGFLRATPGVSLLEDDNLWVDLEVPLSIDSSLGGNQGVTYMDGGLSVPITFNPEANTVWRLTPYLFYKNEGFKSPEGSSKNTGITYGVSGNALFGQDKPVSVITGAFVEGDYLQNGAPYTTGGLNIIVSFGRKNDTIDLGNIRLPRNAPTTHQSPIETSTERVDSRQETLTCNHYNISNLPPKTKTIFNVEFTGEQTYIDVSTKKRSDGVTITNTSKDGILKQVIIDNTSDIHGTVEFSINCNDQVADAQDTVFDDEKYNIKVIACYGNCDDSDKTATVELKNTASSKTIDYILNTKAISKFLGTYSPQTYKEFVSAITTRLKSTQTDFIHTVTLADVAYSVQVFDKSILINRPEIFDQMNDDQKTEFVKQFATAFGNGITYGSYKEEKDGKIRIYYTK